MKSTRCTHGYVLGWCPECKSFVEYGKKVKESPRLMALNKAFRKARI